jgi:hypothetical protein
LKLRSCKFELLRKAQTVKLLHYLKDWMCHLFLEHQKCPIALCSLILYDICLDFPSLSQFSPSTQQIHTIIPRNHQETNRRQISLPQSKYEYEPPTGNGSYTRYKESHDDNCECPEWSDGQMKMTYNSLVSSREIKFPSTLSGTIQIFSFKHYNNSRLEDCWINCSKVNYRDIVYWYTCINHLRGEAGKDVRVVWFR